MELLSRAFAMLRRRLGSLFFLGVTARFMSALVIGPMVSMVVGFLVARKGRYSFGNNDILSFALSPTGVITGVVAATLFVFAQTLEIASLLLLGRDEEAGGSPFVRACWRTVRALPRLLNLAAYQCVVLLILAVPFLGAIGLVYWLVWSGLDLNYLVEVKPPRFWIGAGFAAVFATIYGAIAVWLFVRWSFSIAEVMFHGSWGRAALRRSAVKVRGSGWRVTRVALAWLIGTIVVDFLTVSALRFFSIFVLERTADTLVLAVATSALLLALHAVLLSVVGFASNVIGSFLLLQLYEGPTFEELVPSNHLSWMPTRLVVIGVAAGVAGVACVLSVGLISSVHIIDEIEIAGHRGDSHDAPENTVAAFKKAMEAGAEYGELDVQLSKDGVVVVAHDADLLRLANDNRKIRDMTVEELRAVDIGSSFSPEFKGEHVPTLEEIFDVVAGNKLKVLVELKIYPNDNRSALVKKTVDLIHRKRFSEHCIVISLDYQALQEVRKRDPELLLGYLVAESIGNLTKADVEILMVRWSLAKPLLIGEARRRGKPIFAWTVDDPKLMVRLWNRGVASVITNDPKLMVQKREEVRQMSDVERLLLRARYLLGG